MVFPSFVFLLSSVIRHSLGLFLFFPWTFDPVVSLCGFIWFWVIVLVKPNSSILIFRAKFQSLTTWASFIHLSKPTGCRLVTFSLILGDNPLRKACSRTSSAAPVWVPHNFQISSYILHMYPPAWFAKGVIATNLLGLVGIVRTTYALNCSMFWLVYVMCPSVPIYHIRRKCNGCHLNLLLIR